MGRYKQREIIIREFPEVTIVIESRDTIWALPKRASTNIIFHRWLGPPLGTWQNWRKFRERMRANKNITLGDCYRLANHWQIEMQGTTRRPNINLKHTTLGENDNDTTEGDGRISRH